MSDQVVLQFIRDFSSAGQNNNNQRDFGVFTTGAATSIEIFAGAEGCSYLSVDGPVALVRIGRAGPERTCTMRRIIWITLAVVAALVEAATAAERREAGPA